jgi:pyruvate,water dikinase
MVVANRVEVYRCPDGTEFPVTWPDEEAAQRGWRWDQMHCPLPLTPLSTSLFASRLDGAARILDLTGSPTRPTRLTVNGFNYACPLPFADDPAFRAALRARDVERRAGRLLELWEHEYRPEVEALVRALRAFDDPRLTLRDLVDALPEIHANVRSQGELHHLAMGLTQVHGGQLLDFCVAEFGPEGEQVAAELMQGFPNKSLESADALWQLSREALARPAVATLLRDEPPGEVLFRLSTVAGGVEFANLLERFLDVYGHRNESFSELSFPTWREDPRFPLFLLRRYLDTPASSSPAALHAASVRRREQRLAEVEARLAEGPAKLATLRAVLPGAQARTILIEDHNFSIDQQGTVAVRVPCLAIGRHLTAAGAIAAPEDVFYLDEDDLRTAARDPDRSFQAEVAARRAERERWMRVIPPATIGAGAVTTNPFQERFLGPLQEEPQQEGTVSGVAASAGVMRGTARLVLTLDDIDRLAPGDVLVTYATAPPWTPLFAIAGAVVTDAGGIISHCAVVAREYGIPAVVGCRSATRRIPDGALITVDGTRGVVTLEA